jgi:hypothetical protein
MLHSDTVIRRNPRVAHRELGDEGSVLLHLDSTAYHGLNPIGTFVWHTIGEGTTLDALLGHLGTELKDAPDDLRYEIVEFLSALSERELILVDGN